MNAEHHENKRKAALSMRLPRMVAIVFCYLAVLAFLALGWLYASLPDVLYVEKGESARLARLPFVSACRCGTGQSEAAAFSPGSYNETLGLYGVMPIKTIRTVITDRPAVTVCGTPFGIKLFSDGALIVSFSDIYTASGAQNPAKAAGLHLGDLVVSMDGTHMQDNDAVAQAIHASQGRPITVVFVREGISQVTHLTPVQEENGDWKAGMWVRDSSAGVGTMTFVCEANGIFAGLGHSISDSDTGASIALRSGEIVPCEIVGYTAGATGAPGELEGRFLGLHACGTVLQNGSTGVYGTIRSAFAGTPREVAFAQEVQLGAAELWTTIDGTEPKAYTVEIERINYTDAEHRNMIVHVTDETLLEATGGIVQGMSGSPILQNGRLIGAVTHVLINDSSRGYAIFAQTMLEEADKTTAQAAA